MDTRLRNFLSFLSIGGNRNADKYTVRVKAHLQFLVNNGYISLAKDTNLKETNINQQLLLFVNEEKFNPQFYTQLFVTEYNKITEYKTQGKSIAPNRLLQILCYIRFGITKRSLSQSKHFDKEKVPEIFYHHVKDIGVEISTVDRIVSTAIDILKNKLNILYYEPLPRYKDNYGNWHTKSTIFANYYEPDEEKYIFGYENEIKWGKEKMGIIE